MSARVRAMGVAVTCCALALLGMKGEPFRYERSVECRPGFCVVELPGDVFLVPKERFEKYKTKPNAFAAE